MLQRLKQELKRLFCTKQTWLLVAVIIFGPVLIVTDFLGLGTRVYDTTISNVLMLHPARLSLYISAFSLMAFTLLQLQKLYNSEIYTILEATVDPLTQIVLQTIAIGIITITSVCALLLVLYPYTALTMGTLFSFLKFIQIWVYVCLAGMLITLLISSGVFLIFRNFEASLILMSVLMLFSIGQSEESYYLMHWLQTAVTSIADGTESTVRFKVMFYTRLVGILASIGVYAAGFLCVRRYSNRIAGSIIQNVRHIAVPLLLVFSIVACGFYTNNDPLYDEGNNTLLANYVVDTETQTIGYDDTEADAGQKEDSHHINLNVRWTEMHIETMIESDCLHGKCTHHLENLSEKLEEQEIAIRIMRGIEPTQILCNGEPLDFYREKFSFVYYYYYYFTLPAGLETATLEILFEGYPKGATNYTELSYAITAQYVELADDYPYLMTGASDIRTHTISLSENLTLIVPGAEVEEVTPVAEGYRTYTFIQDRTEGLLYYTIYAGDYLVETTQVGDLKIQFAYFKKKAGIMQEIGVMQIIEDAVIYFTDLYGPLEFGEDPLIIAESERNDTSYSWQSDNNLCIIGESALVSSLYRTEQDSPDTSRSAGLQSFIEAIAKQWWNAFAHGAVIEINWDYNLSDAFTNYSTYLYLKHLYGDSYADQTLKEPWYKIAKYQKNEFYRCNKQYISILPLKDAAKIYFPYQIEEQEREYIVTAALFHAEELVGGEDVLVEKLAEIYNEFKGGNETYLQTFRFLYNDLFFEMLGLTQEEFEAW